MNIRVLACEMAEAVQAFMEKARRFFYSATLVGHRCPSCNGSLTMLSEGECRCVSCGEQFDPTMAFQRCAACGGIPILRVRRYQCQDCGGDVVSTFLFDGLVFDREYFRVKMLESRQRRRELRERVRQMLAESHSGVLSLEQADLHAVPGLVEALNALTVGVGNASSVVPSVEFDLRQYENHVRAHIHDYPLSLTSIPPLDQNGRRDLIWRFIAVIFLAHAGVADVWQEGPDVMVTKHETDGEGQDISGKPEGPDGVEGPVGRAEAC